MSQCSRLSRFARPAANGLPPWARGLAVLAGVAIYLGVLTACSMMDDDVGIAGRPSTRSGPLEGKVRAGKALAVAPADLTDHGAIVPTEVDSSGLALGSSPLATDVSSDGAAQVTMPIWTPPGRAGMTPSLAFQYNSRGGNGVAGIGWELVGAGSVIAACSPPHRWRSSGTGYCLDGQYLRNRIDDLFVIENDPGTRLVPIRGNAGWITGWEVHSRDGSIATFEGERGLWLQTRRSDRHGNTLEIRWDRALRVVTEILYSHDVTLDGAEKRFVNRVVFEYSFTRPDTFQVYSRAGRYWMTKRLDRVVIRGRYEDTPDAVLREYKLVYEQAGLSRRSRLRSLQECAFGICMRPKELIYTEPLPSYTTGYFGRPFGLRPGISYLDVADLDSDGHDDLIYRAPDGSGDPKWWATTYQQPDQAEELGLPGEVTSLAKFPPIFADFNADRAMDVLLHVAAGDGYAAYYQHYRWDRATRRFEFIDDSNIERLTATAGLPDFVPIVYQYDGSGLYSVNRLSPAKVRTGEWDYPGMVWISRTGQSREIGALSGYEVDYQQSGDVTLPIGDWGSQCLDNPIAIPLDEDGDGYRRLVRQRWQVKYVCNAAGTYCDFYCQPQPWLDLGVDVSVTPEGGAYYALDVLGDGGDDLVSMDGTDFYLRPNATGARLSYAVPEPYSFGEQERNGKDRGLRFFDWDLDGATDILLATSERTGGGDHPVMLTYDFSGGLRAHLLDTVAMGDVVGDVSMTRVLDWNGDGLPDIATVRDDFFTVSQKDSVPTDSLVRIEENGFVQVEFAYAPTSDRTVYSNTACAVGLDCMARGMWVVKTHVVHDRPGGHAMYHSYDSGFFDRSNRRWLGMTSHKVNDGATGAVTVTRFDPTRREDYAKFPYAGLPVEVEHRLGNRTSTTRSTYTLRVSSRGDCTDCFEYPRLDDVDKRIVETVDGVTSEVMRVVETYRYDDFGNVTWTKSSSDEETLTTDTAFLNDTTNWLIGLPTRVSTTSEVTSSRMRATRVVSMEYRADGTLERVVTEPDATDGKLRSATEYIWQGGLLSSATVTAPDQLPRASTYAYRDGQLYTVQNALGHTSAAVYSGLGTIAATTDSSGVMTTMTYDGFGRPRSVSPADGSLQWVESARDGDGIATTARNAGGGSSVTRFDRFGRAIETTGRVAGGSSLSVSYLYDYRNLMYARTLPRAPGDPEEWATYVRDAVGRLTLETVPGQPARSWSYSGRTSVETVGDRSVTTSRDGHGRVATVRTATGRLPQRRTVRLSYGPFNTLVRRAYRYSKSQPLYTKSQSFEYDAWNRLSSASDPDRGLREFEYNGYGELAAEVLANGIRTEFQYDQLGRLTSATSTGDASHTEYDWGTDDHPGLLDWVSVDGAVTSYGYDEIGRVASRSLSVRDVALTADFTYDDVGRLSTVTYPEGAQGRPSVRYEYDDVGELVKLHDERTLEPLWERTSVNHRGQHTGHRLGNGVTSTFQYNSSWRTIERARSVSSSGESVLDFEWKYSLLDSRVDVASRIDHARGKQQRYRQYDDQLQSWSAAAAGAPDDQHDAAIAYEYDDDVAAVRRSVHGPDGESLEQHDFDIDRNRETENNQIARSPWGTYTYDASGNQVQRPGQAVTYTARGLPRTVTDDSAGTFQFAYDAAGGRVMKERDDGSYTIYLDKLYERRRTASGEIQDVYYFMATGLVGQLSVKTPAGGESTAATHYFHGDEQGSVRVITDSTGAVSERLDYDPFGSRIDLLRPTEAGLASAITTRGYTGHEHDDDLGLINMGGRVYDPALMRFLSPDPLTAPMTENRAYDPYTYARLNPARYVDPSGFTPCGVSICISNDGVSSSWQESGHHFSYSQSSIGGGMTHVGFVPATSSLRPTSASTMGRAETAWAAVAGAFSSGVDMLGSASSAVADGAMWTAQVGKAVVWESMGTAWDTAKMLWRGNQLRLRYMYDPVDTFREEWDKKGHLVKAIWNDPGGVAVAVAGSAAQQAGAVVQAAGDGDPEAVAKIAVFIGGLFVGGGSGPSKAATRVLRAGDAGRHADLVKAGRVGDGITPHHMPQAAQGFTSPAEGGSLALPHAEHALTRTYGPAGRATLRAENGMSFRDVLARDVRDIRANFGPKYDQGIRDLLQYYRANFPGLIGR